MKRIIPFIAFALAMIMTFGSLVACNGGPSSTDSDTGSPTEGSSESLRETESNSESTEEGSTGEGDKNNDPNHLTLAPLVDMFPEVEEYEKVISKENNKPASDEKFNERIEAENYNTTTFGSIGSLYSAEYSGGLMLKLLTNGEPVQGWEHVYSINYTVTVPRKGYYRITALTSTLSQAFTSDYSLDVNGVKEVIAVEDAEILEDIDYSFDSDLMYLYELGTIALDAGRNTFSFTIDNEDSEKSKNRIAFFMDYFTVSEAEGIDIDPDISIGADISGFESSDVISGAAEVNVFDQRVPLKLSFAHYFTESGETDYTITDYFGKTVYEGKIAGEKYDLVKMEHLIKNHPTGYFTFSLGRGRMSYIVTPSYASRTLEDSPFAMDLAAYYHIKTLANCYNVTSAARLAGVTWVRDRGRWNEYESTEGNYDFSSTDKLFSTIDSTGMKLLVNLCGAPAWASESLGYTGSWPVAGFRDSQIAIFNMCKAMAEHYEGVVDAWELWNESDHASGVENAEHFAAWYKAGALGILDSAPNTTVMFGGYCRADSDLDYDHLSMINDILRYSNTFNYHSHILQPKEYEYTDFTTIYMSEMAHASLSLYNTELHRPSWITEAGMRIDNMVQESYSKQANYIITSTAESLSIGTEKHFWFVIAPYMEGGGDFGTFSPDLEPYPTLAAEAIMTKVLGKAEYVGKPAGLSKNAYGHTFYTGERFASVLWSIRNGDKYVIQTDAPVIVTDMMGNETLYQPENGKITVRMGINPIYVTYSDTPDYLPHDISNDEISKLSFTAGERVILSPEFENYDVNDVSIRKDGHLISDGLKIRLRVTNLNSFEVKGTVSATLAGFEIIGGDEEITVAPYAEEFVTLTLRKTGVESINSYIRFIGIFNGENTSMAAAHVYTEGAADNGTITFDDIFNGQAMSLEKDLKNITATLTGNDGTPVVLINGKAYEKYTYSNSRFTLDLYGMDNGKYTLIVAVKTDGGDYIFKNIVYTVENGKYTFFLP